MNLEIRHIPSGTLFICVLIVLGIWGIMELEFGLFPAVSDPRLSGVVEIEQPNEFLESIAPVIISRLEQNPNVMEAAIRLDGHTATLFVKMTSSNNAGAQKHIQEHLDEVFNDLIWNGEIPVLQIDNRHEIPLTALHITTMDFATLESWVKHYIIQELWRIDGVGRIELIGSGRKGFGLYSERHLPDSIVHTLNDNINSLDAISSNNGDNWEFPGEKVGKLMDTEAIHGLRMKNLFKVTPMSILNSGWAVRDGQPVLILKVYPSENSDILRVNEALMKLVEGLSFNHPDKKIFVFNNRVNLVRSEIGSMWVTLISAFILCLILVCITFRDVSMCLWIVTVLMLTISGVALICAVFNLTLNLISIVGIVLGIGMLIDNPIIVGETLASAGSLRLRHVWRSLVVSNSTTLFMFIPALWLIPFTKELFGGMFIIILLLLFFSMVFCYLVKPWAARKNKAPSLEFHNWMYCRSPRCRNACLGILVLTLITAVLITPYLRMDFFTTNRRSSMEKIFF